MKINCFIVEDELASQEILQNYIASTPQLKLVGICANAIEANELLSCTSVDLIFLDINMPVLSGVKFYQSLTNPPMVIFTTAYPQYAVEGFELNAVDYLLKPFPFERFLKAINKVLDRNKVKTGENEDFLFIQADKKTHKLALSDIYYLQGYGDYVKIFWQEEILIVHETPSNLQEKLPADQFYRIHKSYIISLPKLEYIEGNRLKIHNQLLPISNTYRTDFFVKIKS